MITKLIRMATMLLGAYLLILTGCSDQEHFTDPVTGTGENGETTITLSIPTPVTMGTYAMTGKQECDIVAIDVLIFDPAGKFLYREIGTGISDGGAENKKYFSVKIKKTSDPTSVTAFVYANARDQIDAALANGTGWLITETTTKAEVIEKLVFDLPTDQTSENQGGKWLVLPGRYTRFPMWGQTGVIDLTLSSVIIPEVTMIRAVAKIDVGLSFPTSGTQAEQDIAAGLDNFYLEEFYLYNAYDKLQVTPTASIFNGTAVTDVSIPAGTGVFGDAGNPISYTRRTYNADGYKSFMNEIYLAEHKAGSDSDRPDNPCIVVGGRFGGQTAGITYYRIDMVKNTYDGVTGEITAQEYLPVLRNHRYKINITEVHGRGYDTPHEAFDAMGLNTNLTVVITSQDERVTEIVYDGQYMLGVDRVTVNVDSRENIGKRIYINTDYPQGWKATTDTGSANWLTLNVTSGSDGGSWLTYSVNAYTGGTQPRSGVITIQAGRLFMDVQIIQSHIADIEFKNVENFYEMEGTNKTFTVKSNYNWKVKIEDEYNIITDFDLSGIANTSGTTYNFTMVNDIVMEVLADKTATLTFYSETDEFTPATVDIRGLGYLDIAGLQVFPYDLSPRNWTNAHAGCTALPAANASRLWRRPTTAELLEISKVVRTPSTNLTYYKFTSAAAYWTSGYYVQSAITYPYYIVVSTGQQSSVVWSSSLRTRCVRDKLMP